MSYSYEDFKGFMQAGDCPKVALENAKAKAEERNLFDEGYECGFKAGVRFAKEQNAKALEEEILNLYYSTEKEFMKVLRNLAFRRYS